MAGVGTPSDIPEDEALGDLDLEQLEGLASLTPAERLRRHEQALELVRALREAGKRHYGFDPRAPEKAD